MTAKEASCTVLDVNGEPILRSIRLVASCTARLFAPPQLRRTCSLILVINLALLLLIVDPGNSAETETTLRNCLARTYESNPELASQRAILRATDERLPQAKENWFRPTLSATGGAEWEDEESTQGFDAAGSGLVSAPYHTRSLAPDVNVNLGFPLFRSGQTVYEIKTAEAAIDAGQWDLVSTEQSVLGQAARAYASVVLYRTLVEIDQREVNAYIPLLKMAKDMYQSRTATITDLAQVEVELAQANATLANDQGLLETAEANYQAVVGIEPSNLAPLPRLEPSVHSLEEAEELGFNNNPMIRSAEANVEQAQYAVSARKTALLPTVGLSASFQNSWDDYTVISPASSKGPGTQDTRVGSVGVTATIPIYSGGIKYSYIREALQDETASELSLTNTRRQQISILRGTWKHRKALERVVKAYMGAVSSAKTAVEGKTREYKNGTTTMQEVLLVQESLYSVLADHASASNQLFQTEVDLLQSLGTLTAAGFQLPLTPYDPQEHLEEVRDKIIGW